MTRKEILETAEKMVNGSRQEDYGSAENNFSCIASMWREYICSRNGGVYVDIDAKDVAAMLILLKVARIASGHAKSDNWIDAAGYAACGGEIESKWNGEDEAPRWRMTDEPEGLTMRKVCSEMGFVSPSEGKTLTLRFTESGVEIEEDDE